MLPEILTGQKNAAEWAGRRQELMRLFEEYEYGRTPCIQLDRTAHSITVKHVLKNDIVYEAHRLYFQKGEAFATMRFEMYYREAEKPVPAIMMIDVFDTAEYNLQAPELSEKSRERFPYEVITDAGYAAILIHTNDLSEDSIKRFDQGILQFSPRKTETDWGSLGAWAWGVSRVVDTLCDNPRIDETKLAVLGVSRAGKAALWCGAQDERIAVVIPVVSGCGGTSILRGKQGEHIRDMTKLFPYWTCERYAQYAEKEEEFPVDQHMLIALCAPRPIYISDAIEDTWADPHATFAAACLAGEVYELLGKKGLSGTEFPPVETPLMDGDIAYHVRSGEHGIKMYDWEQYLKFLKKYF